MASRPAKVGETLITTTFRGTSTRGFAAEAEPEVAVCLLPGTELAFEDDVKYDHRWIWKKSTGFKVARFRKVELNVSHQHHDAIEFPNGSYVLIVSMVIGALFGYASDQLAKVLPTKQPTMAAHA